MSKIRFLILVFFILLTYSCSTVPPKPAYELLGGNRDSKIYLACNLWFAKSNLIPVENYPKGRLLKAGNEVKILSYNQKQIVFSTAFGDVFTILYNDQRTMMPVEEYIKLIFSLKNPTDDINKRYFDAVMDGKLVRGMSKKETFIALGPPMMTRTPNWLENGTWTYWTDFDKYRKVVFKDNKIMEIIE